MNAFYVIDFLKYPFQSKCTLYSCLNVKELQALRNREKGGGLGGARGRPKVDLLPIDNNIEKKRGVKKWLVTLLLFT